VHTQLRSMAALAAAVSAYGLTSQLLFNSQRMAYKRAMRRVLFSLGFLSLTVFSFAQPRPSTKTENAAIQHVKKLLVSSFDSRLPNVNFEYFLRYETEDAPIKWDVADCGKQFANPTSKPSPLTQACVQADVDLTAGGAVTLIVSVAVFKDGRFGDAALVSTTVTELTGNVRNLSALADLPMELHRPLPKPPKDLPIPAGDSQVAVLHPAAPAQSSR
jgi:hypothetical protein